MKVAFSDVSATQALFCSRGKNSTTENTFTCFLLGGKLRFDYSQASGSSTANSLQKDVVYTITSDGNAKKGSYTDGTTSGEVVMTGDAFTPGSVFSFFASHQKGTDLCGNTSMGNCGSYKLYSVKIYNKDGKLVRNFVPVKDVSAVDPRCQAGLFDRVTRAFFPNCGTGAFACGEATGERDADKKDEEEYEIEVAAGQQATITAEQVSAAAGKTLVKTGGGTLYAGDAMADFAGDIRIRDGYYVLQTVNALGTGEGETFVEDGGTLVEKVQVLKADGTGCAFPKERIHLKGNGYEGWGALQDDRTTCTDFCQKMVLDGPTRINTSQRLDFRSTTFEMNWHPLELVAQGGGLLLVNETYALMGDIDVKSGYLELQANQVGVENSATITARTGATFQFWGCPSWINSKFVFEPGSKIACNYGDYKIAGTDNRSVMYEGLVTLQGMVTNNLSKNTQFQFRGPITGDGGFVGGKGGYLQFLYSGCDFKGGVDLSGVVENGWPVGGVVLYNNACIPNGPQAAPLKINDAQLIMRDVATYDLPPLVLSNRVVVTNQSCVTKVTAPDMRKIGSGELTVFGPLNITGNVEIAQGSVRLATRAPTVPAGLTWTYWSKASGKTTNMGLDTTGIGYAYKTWPNPTPVDQTFEYKGYINVPGEGATVKCNFMTSIARGCEIQIGGVLCAKFNDDTNEKDGGTTGWTRLAMYKPVDLPTGWQAIWVRMNNWYNSTRGPQANTKNGWAENFGIGVDWQARCVTNTAYYAKLLDPGDGSFLRPSIADDARAQYVAPSMYRAEFNGNVGFGSGTILDLNDVTPYLPMKMKSLSGVPTVKNGLITVESSTWTLRKSDLLTEAGKAKTNPMGVAEGGAIVFPAGTITIDVSDADAAALKALRASRSCPIIADTTAFPNNTFVLSQRLAGTEWYLEQEGNTLKLCRKLGMTLIFK